MSARRARAPALAVIGAGRLAQALVPLLVRAGYPVAQVRRPRTKGAPARAARAATVVLLAVPDRALARVAGDLARELRAQARGKVFLHHAGALGTEPLAPLARLGAEVGVLHPLQCLGLPRVAARTLPGSWARIEGDPRARATARRLARALGLRVLPLPARPRADQRAAYHAAASLVANDLVALLSLAADLFGEIGLAPRTATAALERLAHGTLEQLAAGGVAAALTGPAARGDVATVRAQLRRIARSSPTGAAAHRALSAELTRLAHRLRRGGSV